MPYAELKDTSLFYEDTGGAGPAVIFSHGLMMDLEMFDAQVEALRDRYRCISYDARGHGRTRSHGSFTYWDIAGDVVELMDHLDIDAASLVGMSQGGFVSLRVALAAPQRVVSLALIDTQAGAEESDRVAVYDAMVQQWRDDPGSRDALAEAAAAVILGASVDAEPWKRKWLRRRPDWVEEPYRTLTTREDIHDRLREIKHPAVVIHGSEDAAIPLDAARVLCDGLSGCDDVVVIDGSGHAANMAAPQRVNDVLHRFFTQRR